MNSSESAEQMIKITLEGTEVALKITGQFAERIAVALFVLYKNKKMTKGKTNINNMLKTGSPLSIFSLKEDQLKKFHELAKQYGILYTVMVSKKKEDKDGMVDIMVKETDAPKINRIVDKFNLTAFDIASIRRELEKDKEKKAQKKEEKSNEEKLAEDILSIPTQQESGEALNPQEALAEKSPLSEPLSKNKENSRVISEKKRFSVREALRKIQNEIKTRELTEGDKEELKNGQTLTFYNVNKKKTTSYKNTSNGIEKSVVKWKKEKER